MSRRHDDDLNELLSELSGTLSELQDVLADEERRRQPRDQHQPRQRRRPPSPGRFLRFTEEYTIPTLISLLETNIRALELLQGLLRLVNGRDDGQQSDSTPFRTNRGVRTTGRRTLDALDDALSDLQGALDGKPTGSEARTLLDDARSLREEIDTQLTGSNAGTEQRRSNNRDQGRDQSQDRGDDGAITIDVEDEIDSDENESTDEMNVDDELDTIKRELRDDDDQGRD